MTILALIRHGATRWNEAGRIQGWTDVGLSPAGRAGVAAWRLPDELARGRWVSSPLLRAVHTAQILGARELGFEPRLVEMNWGDWEGMTLEDLRRADPVGLATIEARGLDFRPRGGESPREVQARLAPWLAAQAAAGGRVTAVAHKGVIRALFARAVGWDLMGKPPVKLDWASAHLFRLEPDGTPRPERLNLRLGPKRA